MSTDSLTPHADAAGEFPWRLLLRPFVWAALAIPPLALGVELFTHACMNLLIDPIPTWAHVALVALVPIAAFREGRRIPRYPMEVVEPVFSQYIDEVPLNHLDLPPDELPQTRDDMRDLIDQASRWLNP